MFCKAIYSEDGVEYEGEITAIESDDSGQQYVVVKFVGYGNEDSCWLNDLLPSSGEEARKAQMKAAGVEDAQTTETEKPVENAPDAVDGQTPVKQVRLDLGVRLVLEYKLNVSVRNISSNQLSSTVWKLRKFTLTLFRESNVLQN